MALRRELKVLKPLPRTDIKETFQVLLSTSNLIAHNLSHGDLCEIKHPTGLRYPAIVSSAPKDIKDGIQISREAQDLYDLQQGNIISISPRFADISDAQRVQLCEVCVGNDSQSLDKSGQGHWAWILEYSLEKAKLAMPGMVIHEEVKGEKKAFRVQVINDSNRRDLYRTDQNHFKVEVVDIVQSQVSANRHLTVPTAELGGLDCQLRKLNKLVRRHSSGDECKAMIPTRLRNYQGSVLLYGTRGTGKTTVLQALRKAGWKGVYEISHDSNARGVVERQAAVKRLFSEALCSQPSIIIVDSLEEIVGRRIAQDVAGSKSLCLTLVQELERIKGSRVMVVAATRDLLDIPQDLRSPGVFDVEVETPIPDSNARAEILKILCGIPKEVPQPVLDDVALRTHGYVGGDLKRLWGHAVTLYEDRYNAPTPSVPKGNQDKTTTGKSTDDLEDDLLGLNICGVDQDREKLAVLLSQIKHDFEDALLQVRPTAMQEIFVEVPKVRWEDIGGQRELKRRLERAVMWQFKYPNEMTRFGNLRPKKGLLLYGPPGCSKTMTARALATESGLNFIAVKGAELLSMYVGESERAVREVFSKARMASPCIIFFDEIDAIATSRDSSQQGGIHTVTTLLNELDGFEELKGVFVLAATNKPEILDPALIRAGRLSKTVYVGLPDIEARKGILQMQLRSMALAGDVDERVLLEATDGYSGAEIVAICEEASWATFDEQVEAREARQVGQRHFEAALKEVEKSVSAEMIKKYELWGSGRY